MGRSVNIDEASSGCVRGVNTCTEHEQPWPYSGDTIELAYTPEVSTGTFHQRESDDVVATMRKRPGAVVQHKLHLGMPFVRACVQVEAHAHTLWERHVQPQQPPSAERLHSDPPQQDLPSPTYPTLGRGHSALLRPAQPRAEPPTCLTGLDTRRPAESLRSVHCRNLEANENVCVCEMQVSMNRPQAKGRLDVKTSTGAAG